MFGFLKRWFTKKRKYTPKTVSTCNLLDLVDRTLHDLPYPYSVMRACLTLSREGIRVTDMGTGQYWILSTLKLHCHSHSPREFIRYLQEKLK